MRKTLLLTLLICLFNFSCESKTENKKVDLSEEPNTTAQTYLGLTLGISEEQFKSQLTNLVISRRLRQIDNGTTYEENSYHGQKYILVPYVRKFEGKIQAVEFLVAENKTGIGELLNARKNQNNLLNLSAKGAAKIKKDLYEKLITMYGQPDNRDTLTNSLGILGEMRSIDVTWYNRDNVRINLHESYIEGGGDPSTYTISMDFTLL